MTDLERFTETMAKMMGYCKYAPLNEDDDCLFHDEYICETNKLCSKVGWSPITPDGELTPEVRKWLEQELPEAWKYYLSDTSMNAMIMSDGNIIAVLNAQLDWRNLWGWMKENTDSWLYRKCTTCNGSGLWYRGGDKEFCISCNGTGRVAKWDVEKWLEGK